MRLTNKLYAQHIGWTFKKHWIIQNQRIPRDSGVSDELQKLGISVKDIPIISELESKKSTRGYEEHPNWHTKPCHVFGGNNVLIQGMEQALLLTKSIEIPSLPKCIQKSMEKFQMTALLESKIKEAVIASHLLNGDQIKLPKNLIQLRTEQNLPREYGASNERKTSILINKLISECEKYAGRIINTHRGIIDNAHFKVAFPKNDDLIQFVIKANKIVTSSRPVEVIKGKYDYKLPDIQPVNETISMPKQHIYTLETIYPFSENLIHSHPHTIFVYYDKEKVKNIYDAQVNISQFQSRNMLTAFCVAAARAKQLHGDSAYNNISRPIVVQSIQTDGKTFHFGVFQLNSLRIDRSDGPKNYWFHMENQDLFHLCCNSSGMVDLTGFNKDVFRYLYAFYSNS